MQHSSMKDLASDSTDKEVRIRKLYHCIFCLIDLCSGGPLPWILLTDYWPLQALPYLVRCRSRQFYIRKILKKIIIRHLGYMIKDLCIGISDEFAKDLIWFIIQGKVHKFFCKEVTYSRFLSFVWVHFKDWVFSSLFLKNVFKYFPYFN